MQSQPIQDPLDPKRTVRLSADRDAKKVNASDLDRLKQLIQTLRALSASLPADLQGLIGGLIAEAEDALKSGDPIAIGRLIAKIEEALALLQEIIRLLNQGDLEAANEVIAALVTKLTGMKKIKDKMIRQQEASMEASLEAMMNMKFGNL